MTTPISTGPVNIAFPFQVDKRGRIAVTDYASHIRDIIEQLLFTSPGERVVQPDLGCGLADLVFAPNSPELASAVQASTQGALQRWLGDVITVVSLSVTADDATLGVTVNYQIIATGQQATATITGQVA
ncbi:MAG: GPW/gp25 family protein [Streptosporangiaceae bacterium]